MLPPWVKQIGERAKTEHLVKEVDVKPMNKYHSLDKLLKFEHKQIKNFDYQAPLEKYHSK